MTGTLEGRRAVTRFLMGLGILMALFLVLRGIAEPFVIDMGDPGSYRSDWGGPSLVGVLAVHSGPAVVVLTAAGVSLARRLRSGGTRHDETGSGHRIDTASS